MRDNQDQATWSKRQASVYKPGQVQIYGVDVRRAIVDQSDPGCAQRVIVPNVLSSRDRLNEHGLVELEI